MNTKDEIFTRFKNELPLNFFGLHEEEKDQIFDWWWKEIAQREADFKASLREEIEKLPNDGLINGRKKGRQALLDLIDNVKPSTSQPEGNTVNQ